MKTCTALTKNGQPCRAPAVAPDSYCYFHADPGRARQLGRMGGRQNRRPRVDLEIPDKVDAVGLRDLVVKGMRALLAGEMPDRTALTFTQMCNSLQRVLPMSELEEGLAGMAHKLAEVEQQLTQMRMKAPQARCPSTMGSEADATVGGTDTTGSGEGSTRTAEWTVSAETVKPQSADSAVGSGDCMTEVGTGNTGAATNGLDEPDDPDGAPEF